MKRHVVSSIGIALLLSGCISYSDKPTQLMVDQQLQKTKKLVSFSSDIAAHELTNRALKSSCGSESKTFSTVSAIPGVGHIGVANKYDYSVDHGTWPDGTMWVALRTDGMFHGTPMGYRLSPTASGGTDVVVYAADKRKLGEIKERVEAGSLFCEWGKYSYPYD